VPYTYLYWLGPDEQLLEGSRLRPANDKSKELRLQAVWDVDPPHFGCIFLRSALFPGVSVMRRG
jgi:hypothetical protein